MVPWFSRCVSEEVGEMFEQIKKTVEKTPDMCFGKRCGSELPISCHLITHALADFFPVICHDGYFGQIGISHSWLIPEKKMFCSDKRSVIIDVYPVAIPTGPIIVITGPGLPWEKMYQRHRLNELSESKFLSDLSVMKEAVRRTIEFHKI